MRSYECGLVLTQTSTHDPTLSLIFLLLIPSTLAGLLDKVHCRFAITAEHRQSDLSALSNGYGLVAALLIGIDNREIFIESQFHPLPEKTFSPVLCNI